MPAYLIDVVKCGFQCTAMKFTKENNLFCLQLQGVGNGRDFMFWTTSLSDKIQFNANWLKYLISLYQAGCCKPWGWDMSIIISFACTVEGWNFTELNHFKTTTKTERKNYKYVLKRLEMSWSTQRKWRENVLKFGRFVFVTQSGTSDFTCKWLMSWCKDIDLKRKR